MGSLSQNTTTHSTASEAIFSKSGQVKTLIRNYETTVVDTSDKQLVFPPEESSNDIDISGVLSSVSDITTTVASNTKKPVRFSTALVSFIIAITFSWSVYSLFFTVKRDTPDIAYATSHEQPALADSSSLTELKRSADLLLATSAWKSGDINLFLNNWNQLSENQVRQVTKTSWYQLLEFKVKKHINQRLELLAKNQVASMNEQSLLTLGLVMGISDQTGNEITANSKYDKLLAELTNELKIADKHSKTSVKLQESESDLNSKLRERYAAVKQELTVREPAAVTTTKLTTPLKPAEKVTVGKPPKITQSDINEIISKYKQAYEKGDIHLMTRLFGATKADSDQQQKVASTFTTTFNNTGNRTMNIYDVHTNSSGATAVVDSKFNTSVDFKNGKGTQYTVANMKLFISKSGNQVTINRINILDRKVNVVEKERNLLESSNGMLTALDNNIHLPTAAELQDITTQLVTSYETGNLEQFVSLFSTEIKTNDRIDLTGVKQDYAELFASTSDRQMFIQNLKWSEENIGAKGTGDLEVIIFSEEGNTVYSMEGKIQIVAQKIGSETKITHLYHIERAK